MCIDSRHLYACLSVKAAFAVLQFTVHCIGVFGYLLGVNADDFAEICFVNIGDIRRNDRPAEKRSRSVVYEKIAVMAVVHVLIVVQFGEQDSMFRDFWKIREPETLELCCNGFIVCENLVDIFARADDLSVDGVCKKP